MKPVKFVGRPQWKGKRGGNTVVVVDDEGHEHRLDLHLHLFPHSPSGFAWGYGGSGPAQLALAILAKHLKYVDDKRVIELKVRLGQAGEDEPPIIEKMSWRDWLAIRLHQDFKFAVIGGLPQEEGFTITNEQVAEAIDHITTE